MLEYPGWFLFYLSIYLVTVFSLMDDPRRLFNNFPLQRCFNKKNPEMEKINSTSLNNIINQWISLGTCGFMAQIKGLNSAVFPCLCTKRGNKLGSQHMLERGTICSGRNFIPAAPQLIRMDGFWFVQPVVGKIFGQFCSAAICEGSKVVQQRWKCHCFQQGPNGNLIHGIACD